ncbi:hypothetical protein ACLB2K_071721 [Fragaria x ananassa]
MESNKRVGLVAVAAVVVVSTFFMPTVFASRHRNYEIVSAAVGPDSNDDNGVITSALAEPDFDEYDHNIMVKDERSRSATGSKRLEADKGVCIGICCQIVPPPRPPPSPLSPSPPPLTSF